jgi:chromate transporter
MQEEQEPNSQSPSLSHLFFAFLKLGTTAFGGPAMVAYIRKMAVEKNHWLDDHSARDGVAFCQTKEKGTLILTVHNLFHN